MSPSMEQKPNIANKKTSKFALNWLTAKMYTRGNYHFYSISNITVQTIANIKLCKYCN